MMHGVPFSLWQHQAAIVYQMILTICLTLHRDHGRKSHVGAASEELLVAMVIRVNDGAGLPPISISAIGRQLNMSRTSVRRAVGALIRHKGVICKCRDGYMGNPKYVAVRPDADDYIPHIQNAITTAATQLATLRRAAARRGPKNGVRARSVRKAKVAKKADR
ncbi:hypothetical protein NLM33_18910 [Bradyrhizobium sp. CCGUVB1N3]|uniref:hypothetical protein n=1 Tax=Bradyrhizobium sp. CCGUVB1N3 TaxID=2949629 RepID=UPI0020B2DDC2|nr:hypothetical protein [Bradyrhizobium sp. CCGUVB1N3]MCP3472389.1 hypothetical protein [Bradyrhizobium sp. CCGUVB1N3]